MANLPRNERVCDVDEAQPLRKPRERDHGAVEALRWLVATAHRRVGGALGGGARPPKSCGRRRQVVARGVAKTRGGGGGGAPPGGGLRPPPPTAGGPVGGRRPLSGCGIGRQVCVGCANAGLVSACATVFGRDMSEISRMKSP